MALLGHLVPRIRDPEARISDFLSLFRLLVQKRQVEQLLRQRAACMIKQRAIPEPPQTKPVIPPLNLSSAISALLPTETQPNTPNRQVHHTSPILHKHPARMRHAVTPTSTKLPPQVKPRPHSISTSVVGRLSKGRPNRRFVEAQMFALETDSENTVLSHLEYTGMRHGCELH